MTSIFGISSNIFGSVSSYNSKTLRSKNTLFYDKNNTLNQKRFTAFSNYATDPDAYLTKNAFRATLLDTADSILSLSGAGSTGKFSGSSYNNFQNAVNNSLTANSSSTSSTSFLQTPQRDLFTDVLNTLGRLNSSYNFSLPSAPKIDNPLTAQELRDSISDLEDLLKESNNPLFSSSLTLLNNAQGTITDALTIEEVITTTTTTVEEVDAEALYAQLLDTQSALENASSNIDSDFDMDSFVNLTQLGSGVDEAIATFTDKLENSSFTSKEISSLQKQLNSLIKEKEKIQADLDAGKTSDLTTDIGLIEDFLPKFTSLLDGKKISQGTADEMQEVVDQLNAAITSAQTNSDNEGVSVVLPADAGVLTDLKASVEDALSSLSGITASGDNTDETLSVNEKIEAILAETATLLNDPNISNNKKQEIQELQDNLTGQLPALADFVDTINNPETTTTTTTTTIIKEATDPVAIDGNSELEKARNNFISITQFANSFLSSENEEKSEDGAPTLAGISNNIFALTSTESLFSLPSPSNFSIIPLLPGSFSSFPFINF